MMWAGDLVASPLHLANAPDESQKQYSESVATLLEELQKKEKETGLKACLLEKPLSEDATSLPTLEELRAIKVAWLNEECRAKTQNLKKKLDKTKGSCDKQYKAFSAELRTNEDFKTLLAVTLAVKERIAALLEIDDVPESVQKLLTQAAHLWQRTILTGMPVDDQTEDALLSVLKNLEDDMGNLSEPKSFAFAPPASKTPVKRRRPLESVNGTPDCETAPAKRLALSTTSVSTPEVEK